MRALTLTTKYTKHTKSFSMEPRRVTIQQMSGEWFRGFSVFRGSINAFVLWLVFSGGAAS